MSNPPSFGSLIQYFFSEHLREHRAASPNTMDAYRDTFRLLLNYVHGQRGITPSSIQLKDLDGPMILDFLDYLEQAKGSTVCSRNARLAAIRSFFRYAILKDPECISVATRVLAIPVKRTQRKLVGYLTRPEMQAILDAPDRSTWSGRRDHALLLAFYNTGARLSEMTSLKRSQVVIGATSFVHLHGKGRKDREVPLWASTARVLRTWFQECAGIADDVAFPNARGGQLSSDGVSYILRQSVKVACPNCASLTRKRITPHLLRHTTAMHLLQSGVDISVIALWLGHESIETTHMYMEADMAIKEKALERLIPAGGDSRRFKPDDALLAFLASL